MIEAATVHELWHHFEKQKKKKIIDVYLHPDNARVNPPKYQKIKPFLPCPAAIRHLISSESIFVLLSVASSQ